MKQHIVTLTFIYDEESNPQVTDEEEAINQAIKELDEMPPLSFEFNYQLSE